jgi:HK97 gp10 family phage protein
MAGTVEFEWEGSQSPASLVDDLEALEDALDKYLVEAMETLTLTIESTAKSLAPIDTGRLRASIASEVKQMGPVIKGFIGSNTHYASYVEMGTRYQEPQPYLRPAIDAHLSDARRLFKQALEKAVAEVS